MSPESTRLRRNPAATTNRSAGAIAGSDANPALRQAFWLLRIGFTVAPILAGVDKFFNWSVDWPDYLAGWVNDIVPGSGQDFMYALGIVVSLLTNDPPEYYDIALRDFGLMRGALTLGRLAWAIPRR